MKAVLFTYYAFLVAGAILLAVFNRGSPLPEPRRTVVGHLIIPPIILLVSLMHLGFWVTILLTALLVFTEDRWLGRHLDAGVDRSWVYYALGLWLIEAIVPLVVHLTTQSRPDVERWSMLIAAFLLLLAPILVFTVFTRELKRKI
jgi:hypothetical protein